MGSLAGTELGCLRTTQPSKLFYFYIDKKVEANSYGNYMRLGGQNLTHVFLSLK